MSGLRRSQGAHRVPLLLVIIFKFTENDYYVVLIRAPSRTRPWASLAAMHLALRWFITPSAWEWQTCKCPPPARAI